VYRYLSEVDCVIQTDSLSLSVIAEKNQKARRVERQDTAIAPDKFDVIGGGVALAGVLIIIY
jgi:hypothetical protein